MSDEFLDAICVPGRCSWHGFSGTVSCSTGAPDYYECDLLSADISDFHTTELEEATSQIRKVISSIERRDGRDLVFIGTPFGVLLAWVQHGNKIPKNATTSESPREEIIKALGLKDVYPDREKKLVDRA